MSPTKYSLPDVDAIFKDMFSVLICLLGVLYEYIELDPKAAAELTRIQKGILILLEKQGHIQDARKEFLNHPMFAEYHLKGLRENDYFVSREHVPDGRKRLFTRTETGDAERAAIVRAIFKKLDDSQVDTLDASRGLLRILLKSLSLR